MKKRKAQNRAAQRAFRERKEQHLKDLETQVGELTKTQEADKHENGMLKAQVERLQMELREYRKRLSLNGGASRSPPPNASKAGTQGRMNSGTANGGQQNFQFEFPKFGALPGSQIFGNQPFAANGSTINTGIMKRDSNTPPTTRSPTTTGGSFNSRPQLTPQDSTGHSMSPRSLQNSNAGSQTGSPAAMSYPNPPFSAAPYSTNDNMHGFAATLPQMGNGTDPFSDLFSPSIIKSASMDSNSYFDSSNPNKTTNGLQNGSGGGAHGGDTTAGLNRVFQFNSNSSASDSASPSASSTSQWNCNANSSCGTSPEPIHDSPANKTIDNIKSTVYASGQKEHVNPLQMPNAESWANEITGNALIGFTNSNVNMNPNNSFNIPTTSSYDPVLFGDYRESGDTGLGGTDFTGSFFDNEFSNPQSFDFGSPSNLFGILQSPPPTSATLQPQQSAANAPKPSAALMAEMEKAREGGEEDYGLPSACPNKNSARPETKRSGSGKLISCNNIW